MIVQNNSNVNCQKIEILQALLDVQFNIVNDSTVNDQKFEIYF